MSLKFILGKTGSGKTAYCLNEITQGTDSVNYIYIVPEQFSMQSEKELTLRSKSGVLINKKVFSFRHLAMQMISKYGSNKKIFEDTGKNMLLRKLAFELKDRFCFYTSSFDKSGFLDQLSATVTEFSQYNISPDDIDQKLDGIDNRNLKMKLTDINTIYKAYSDYISNELISEDTVLDVLYSLLPRCDIIKNSVIWIDGFNGFTSQELKIINALMLYSEKVTIALTLPSPTVRTDYINGFDPYYATKSTYKKLIAIAENSGVNIERPVFLNCDMRHKSAEALAFLTEEYLNYNPTAFSAATNNIEIYSPVDMYTEITNVCCRIRSLVASGDMNYSDIGVIIGDKTYATPLRIAMKRYEIPAHTDEKKSIMSNMLTKFIISAVNCVAYNFDSECIFSFLKTGLTDISENEIFTIENYVTANGIKGYRWQQDEWHSGFDERSGFDKEEINGIKNKITDILSPITSKVQIGKSYTVRHICIALYNLLYSVNISEKLNVIINDYKAKNNPEAAMENSKIWDIVKDLFEKMNELLGDTKVTIAEYSKILKAGLSASSMGTIPPAQDYVIIGDYERTRFGNIKALFILGVSEGVLPPYREDTGIFSDSERDYISSNCFELSDGSLGKINRDKFIIYTCLSKPSDLLVLSYPTTDRNGSLVNPSSVIDRIRLIFPSIKINDAKSEPNAPIPAFEHLLEYSEDKINSEIYNLMNSKEEFKIKLDNIKTGLVNDIPTEKLSDDIVKKLYGDTVYSSVTRLEQYTRCPFSFFLKYSLKAEERKEYKIQTPDLGNIFHYVIEDFSKNIEKNNLNWRTMSRSDINNCVNESIDKIISDYNNTIFTSGARFRSLVKRVKKTAANSIWALSEHIKEGKFEPYAYELGFGQKEGLPPITFELENGTKLMLTGKIDRVDVFDKDGKRYVKIIDYKTYDTSYNLSSVYYGIQLQLSLYMSKLLENGLSVNDIYEVMPGGMFYFHIKNPILKTKSISIDADNLKNSILKNYDMQGIMLDDPNVTEAISAEEKTKTIKSASIIADNKDFMNILNYVNHLIKDISGKMTDGHIYAKPFKQGTKTACDNCRYKSVCKIDSVDEKNKYNIVRTIPKEVIMQKFEPNND